MTHHDKPHAINPTTITNAGKISTNPHAGARPEHHPDFIKTPLPAVDPLPQEQ